MQTYQFRWDVIPNNIDFLMSGLQMTLIISATALVFAMIGGLLLALVDMSRYLAVRAIGLAIGEVIRNTPILVQLLWVYYVLPIVFNIRISSLAAILIGLRSTWPPSCRRSIGAASRRCRRAIAKPRKSSA